MAFDTEFPSSPYERIDPKVRWFPGPEKFREQLYGQLIPPLVAKIREEVKEWRDTGYEGASDTSKALLNYWFETEHPIPTNDGNVFYFRYYFAQREAVETVIYLHEIAEVKDKYDMLRYDSSDAVRESMFDETWKRFVIKMATGSGKTKVLSLILAWSYFHKLYEEDSTLSRNFLVITPNIIVLDRIISDFDGLRIFYEDPVLPENGYEGQNWQDDFQMDLHIQDNVNMVNKTGNIFLTNIHRVFDSNRTPPSYEDENTSDYFLGERAVTSTTDSKLDLGDIVRDIDELTILNDEAHHIHDKRLAWFKSIEDIHNRLLQKGSSLSIQVDFTATPKHSNGSIFVQTVCDYPLVEAIHQNIVKHPILPDKTSRAKLQEKKTSKYSEKYSDYLELGYQEWKKAYDEHEKLDKKAVMFVMTDDTKNCDEVAEYLENRYSELKNSVLVIHTKKNGEISEVSSGKKKKELDELRNAANTIDLPQNRYKAIVSVLVLKEGWDVRNVTTIVGLRSYTSKANILPEQTLGRGLRRMYRDPEVEEKVSVVGTDAFMEFVESIREEGVKLTERPVGPDTKPIAPIVIEVDHKNPIKDIDQLNIKIPVLSPRIYREYGNLNDIDVSTFNNKKIPLKKYSIEEQREIVFRDIISNEIKHKTKLDGVGSVNYQGIIGYFVQVIMEELRLVSGYDVLYGKVKQFIKEYLFEQPVELEDLNVLKNLSELEATKTVIESFKAKINEITVMDRGEAEIREYIDVSAMRPFVTKERDYFIPNKSVFNKIIGDSHLELEFASFLDDCNDIVSYIKNYFAVHFRIDYRNSRGEISNYYPDFVVKRNENEVYIIETKGVEDLDDPLKLKRLKQWCEDINQVQSDIKFDYIYVNEDKYHKYYPKSFQELLDIFKESSEVFAEKKVPIAPDEVEKPKIVDQPTIDTFKTLSFEQWVESLPFPLASILWSCIVDSNIERKIRYLIHFFEALSEFNVTLLVSALAADPTFYEKELNHCIRTDPRFKGWNNHPAFGNWISFGSCISKRVRELINDKKTKDKTQKIFGNPKLNFIESITSKKLTQILHEVLKYRNEWMGHGPIVSESEQKQRLEKLKECILNAREIVSNNYDNVSLVLPGENTYKDGIFHYKVKYLIGTRPPFKTNEIVTDIPMDSSKKYLIHNTNQPLELLPFFDIIESPEKQQEACYFYNRYNPKDGQARFVSYHFEKEAEIFVSSEKIESKLRLLNK